MCRIMSRVRAKNSVLHGEDGNFDWESKVINLSHESDRLKIKMYTSDHRFSWTIENI